MLTRMHCHPHARVCIDHAGAGNAQQQMPATASSQARGRRGVWLWDLVSDGLSALTRRHSGGGGALQGESGWTAMPVKPSIVNTKSTDSGGEVMVKLALETHFLWMPHNPPYGRFGRVRWTGAQSLGGVVEVDVTNDRVKHQLAHSREPKLVYFAPRGGLPGAKRALFPAVKRLKHIMNSYVAEWGPRSIPMWEAFGVQESDAPVVAIEDSSTGQRCACSNICASSCSPRFHLRALSGVH